MSHHLDSPLARQDPRLNITDQYLFDADAATVFVMNVRTSLAGDQSPDPFHPEARYELKIHLDGNPYEDITYRFSFDSAEDGEQPFTVERLTGDAAREDAMAGELIAGGRTGQILSTDEGGQLWAGQAVEPFFLDLRQLDAVVHCVQLGEDADLTRWVPGVSEDTFTGSTVRSIVLTVPVGSGGLTEGRRIATWSAAKLGTDSGGWRQVGRTGLPMIWPIFRDANSEAASHANETQPSDDDANYRAMLAETVASVVRRRGSSQRPEVYATTFVDRIVPDLLEYVVGSPALFGFTGFNGRRLDDNAPEVMFSLATNSALSTGLRGADGKRSQQDFPFVVPAE
jgi:Domain of unknown function (DUF4331)